MSLSPKTRQFVKDVNDFRAQVLMLQLHFNKKHPGDVLDLKKGTAPGSLSDITGFTDLTATTTAAETAPADVALADGDYVGMDMDSVSGSPDSLVVWLDCEETNS